jgi:hypothetical protein
MQEASERAGFSRQTSNGIIGAVQELVSNVDEHSRDSESGVVAFAGTSSHFEFSVSDLGIGVLASLRSNPEHVSVSDDGKALELSIRDGVSSIPNSGRGYGISYLFRALVGVSGFVRFRSGRSALHLEGEISGERIRPTLLDRPAHNGLTITAICRPSALRR